MSVVTGGVTARLRPGRGVTAIAAGAVAAMGILRGRPGGRFTGVGPGEIITHVRVGVDVIKLIKSSIKSLI